MFVPNYVDINWQDMLFPNVLLFSLFDTVHLQLHTIAVHKC
jgi:hypothetical protein